MKCREQVPGKMLTGILSPSPSSHPREGEAFEGRQPRPLQWQAGPLSQASSSRDYSLPQGIRGHSARAHGRLQRPVGRGGRVGGGQSLDGAALCGPCGPGKGAGVLRMGVLEGGSPGIPQQGPGWGTGRGEGTGEDLTDHEGSGLRQRGQPLCDGGSHGHQEGAILSAPEVEPQVSLGGGQFHPQRGH